MGNILHKSRLLIGAVLLSQFSLVAAQENSTSEELFADKCGACHGMNRAGYIGPALNSSSHGNFPVAALEALITYGIPGTLMPRWEGRLSKEEITGIAELIINEPVPDVSWDMADIKNSLEVYVADETSLPDAPVYPVENLAALMAVMERGYYSDGENARVLFFNGQNHEIVGAIDVDKAPHILDYHPTDERWAYLKTDGGRLYKLDLYSMQATRSIRAGFTGPSIAVSYDGKYVATGSFVPYTVVILDADTLEPVKYFELKGENIEGEMVDSVSTGITATPYGNYFAITLKHADQVWIVDLDTPDFAVTRVKNVGRDLHDSFLSRDGKQMIVASYVDDKLVAVDYEQKKVVGNVPAGCQPHVGSGAIVEVNGRDIGFGTNIGRGAGCDKTVVTAFDAQTFEVIKQIPTIGATESPAAHPDSPYVVVDIVSGEDSAIQFIDKNSLEVVKTMDIGGHAYFPEFTHDGKYIYVSAGYQGNELVIIDAETLSVVKRVPVESPAGIFGHNRPKIKTIGFKS
ncbi:cytochrome D1 domain-containing protein [Aliamphritea hakodatensis]|uniref:cytochrome D1 domain-containing protein n=1 Tax=Aliamphritea hakodatensis TaxID=2895352 RepID=UPI0022FD3B61|nr:cytochrome D1 domain-containing protein [Aliamphritea hakodatensis]